MKYNFLGKSDLKVSNYCLGTMTYGEQTSERDAHLQMDKAFDSGINFFDTAEMYSTCPRLAETAGKTEKIIGTWIKKNPTLRNKLILATKIIGNGDTFIRDGGPINRKMHTFQLLPGIGPSTAQEMVRKRGSGWKDFSAVSKDCGIDAAALLANRFNEELKDPGMLPSIISMLVRAG